MAAEIPEGEVIFGKCAEVLATMPENSFDSLVMDPPYGLGFMGNEWDSFAPEQVAADLERDTRSERRQAYGGASSAPSAAMAAGRYDRSIAAAREFQRRMTISFEAMLRVAKPGAHLVSFGGTRTYHRLTCAIEDAGWEIRDGLMWVHGQGYPKSYNLDGDFAGWGTALKPGWEPIVLARKPMIGTINENIAAHHTGPMNIAGCKIPFRDEADRQQATAKNQHEGFENPGSNRDSYSGNFPERTNYEGDARWPANIIFDSDAAALLDKQSPEASRFFYCPKPSRSERDAGLESLPIERTGFTNESGRGTGRDPYAPIERRNTHPTVKPIALMRWLVRLVTPPNGRVLDPFAGSGTTGCAAVLEGLPFTGIEMIEKHVEIARLRMAYWRREALSAPLDLFADY